MNEEFTNINTKHRMSEFRNQIILTLLQYKSFQDLFTVKLYGITFVLDFISWVLTPKIYALNAALV